MMILAGPAPVSNSQRRWTVTLLFEPRNLWAGIYVPPRSRLGDQDLYVSLAPMLTLKLSQLASDVPAEVRVDEQDKRQRAGHEREAAELRRAVAEGRQEGHLRRSAASDASAR